MKILLTGVTGYIAQRLLPVLLDQGHEVVCCVRDKDRFNAKKYAGQRLTVIEVDFLNEASLGVIPEDIEVAYYLIHSMATQGGDFGAYYTSLSSKRIIRTLERVIAWRGKPIYPNR